jgi:hypothetical protein
VIEFNFFIRIFLGVQRVIGTEHAQKRDIFILHMRRIGIKTPMRAEAYVCLSPEIGG